jgi:hypothetical protein
MWQVYWMQPWLQRWTAINVTDSSKLSAEMSKINCPWVNVMTLSHVCRRKENVTQGINYRINHGRDTQQMLISSFLLCLLVPLHGSASRCHLQGVTVSLFISYARLAAFWGGVGFCLSGVAICCGFCRQPRVAYK